MPVQCDALLNHLDDWLLAEVIDLGVHGLGAHTVAFLATGCLVSVLLDPQQLPAALRALDLPALRTRVAAVRRDGHDPDGHMLYSTGLEFRDLPTHVEAALRRLLGVTGTGAGLASDPTAAAALAESPAGREMLYQSADELLAAGRLADACAAIQAAVRGDPHNPFYRALHRRTLATLALDAGELDRALREVRAGLQAATDDRALLALREQVERAQSDAHAADGRPGLLRRILGRR